MLNLKEKKSDAVITVVSYDSSRLISSSFIPFSRFWEIVFLKMQMLSCWFPAGRILIDLKNIKGGKGLLQGSEQRMLTSPGTAEKFWKPDCGNVVDVQIGYKGSKFSPRIGRMVFH